MRSRTVSRPPSCWRFTFSAPPICFANASRARNSSSSCCQLMLVCESGKEEFPVYSRARKKLVYKITAAPSHPDAAKVMFKNNNLRILLFGRFAPQFFQPRIAAATVAIEFVAHRILLIVILMVFLGAIKLAGLGDLGNDGLLERLG